MDNVTLFEGIPIPSHPWINFKLDLRSFDSATWIAFGECASKCEHIAKTPLRPEVSRKLHEIYLAKGIQATTAIEGNTLTEDEVREALRKELKVPPSKRYLAQEVENIIQAANTIMRRIVEREEPPVTPTLVREYNALVLAKLEVPDEFPVGQYRRYFVGVGGYRGPDPNLIAPLVERLCRFLDEMGQELDKSYGRTITAILKAVFAHLYLAWIHPFGDGNGRTARLLELDILLRSGIPAPAAHLLSNHYNATRNDYYRQLDLAGKKSDPTGFVRYAVMGFRDGLRQQLDRINEEVTTVVWEYFVHESFKGMRTNTAHRQRDAVLDISQHPTPVRMNEIPVLTDRLRNAYRGKTNKTVSRDIKRILSMNLLVYDPQKKCYSANRNLIGSLLPFTRD
jgi:Fic family protein